MPCRSKVGTGTSLRSRYIPCYRPMPARASDAPFCHRLALCFGSCKFQAGSCGGRTLRSALVLRSCDFRAGAAVLRCSALHCADTGTCQEMFPVTDLRNKTSVTDLRNKIRGASRVTDPQKNHSHLTAQPAQQKAPSL